jgi:hypothetical protein
MCENILIRNIVETALVHSAAGLVYSTSCAFLHMLFLLQICKQNCNEVDVKPISGCVRNACSQLLRHVWNKLLSPCYKVDDGNRLATSCSNMTNTSCS